MAAQREDRDGRRRRKPAWTQRAVNLALRPHPLRTATLRLIERRGIGPYGWRVDIGAVERPAYAYCVRRAAQLARRLSIGRISVVEFGVAGGNGLLALEYHAERTANDTGVQIDVFGFDTGHGLPAAADYRDLPYLWQGGAFDMDEAALRRRLRHATLVLGDINETSATFFEQHDPPPIGAAFYDMDLYSSTAAALRLFDASPSYRLPRVFAYFDDIIGHDLSSFSDDTGERLAIAEFNAAHRTQKVSPAYNLSCTATERWHHQVFVVHDFAHPRYCDFIGGSSQELPLAEDR